MTEEKTTLDVFEGMSDHVKVALQIKLRSITITRKDADDIENIFDLFITTMERFIKKELKK